jgi:hypothetical protein
MNRTIAGTVAMTPFDTRLRKQGFASFGKLLTKDECEAIRALYDHPEHFRNRIDMARHRFGKGEYQYFRYPLPPVVAKLREELYPKLVDSGRLWMEELGLEASFPDTIDKFCEQCHRANQCRPTPLLLRYREGDYNCLHQDLYGPVVFPFQVIVGLSSPDTEYRGGELMLVEQRPRAQSKGHVIRLEQGEGVAITTRYRPEHGTRGVYRVNVRHGVADVRAGERFTLGVIFHDAE